MQSSPALFHSLNLFTMRIPVIVWVLLCLFTTSTLTAQTTECAITGLTAKVASCENGKFKVTLDFKAANAGQQFVVTGNGTRYGVFAYNQLPLTLGPITNVEGKVWEFAVQDLTKTTCKAAVALGKVDCKAPSCPEMGLRVIPEPNSCDSTGAYSLRIVFSAATFIPDSFDVWSVSPSKYLGRYDSKNPQGTLLKGFPRATTAEAAVKVCMKGLPACCKTAEFAQPVCNTPPTCTLTSVAVSVGTCGANRTYPVKISITHTGKADDQYVVTNRTGRLFGPFKAKDAPWVIENYPASDNNNEALFVCLAATGNNGSRCCKSVEFKAPTCPPVTPCSLGDLTVKPTGVCNAANGTYEVVLSVANVSTTSQYKVIGPKGVLLDSVAGNKFPLTVKNFPITGLKEDVVAVCQIGRADCCKRAAFEVPTCAKPTCPVDSVKVTVSATCNTNGTYNITVNFKTPANATGRYLITAAGAAATIEAKDLPYTLRNVRYTGKTTETVRVCPLNSAASECCRTVEYKVPECVLGGNCKISNLKATRTACVCGQFFVLLTFDVKEGGNNGVTVLVNGKDAGAFAAGTPVLVGPLTAETDYEFTVTDRKYSACKTTVKLPSFKCTGTPGLDNPGTGRVNNGVGIGARDLVIAPNPAKDHVQVNVVMPGAPISDGASTVQVWRADGTLVKSLTVTDGHTFALEVGDLLSGIYRLVVITSAGKVEGTFVKE